MSDLAPFNATTKPMVYLERDWNSLCDHGLEKTASYIIRKNGVYYEAIKGGTSTDAGTIAFGGADNAGTVDGTDGYAVIQATFDATPTYGKVLFKEGKFIIDTALKPHTMMEIYGNLYRTEINATGAIKAFHLDGINSVRMDGLVISNDGVVAGSGGVYCDDCTFIELRDIWTYGAETGFKFEGSGTNQAIYGDNLHATNGTYGIEITGGVDEVRLFGSRVFDQSARGINIHLVTGGVVHLIHPDVQVPAATYGIYIATASNSEVKIEGGGIYGGEVNSLVISQCTAPSISVADFTVLTATQRGIWIFETDYVRLNCVNVQNCSSSGVGLYGGIDLQNSEYTHITDSYIAGANHKYDFYENGTSANNWISNSYLQTAVKSAATTRIKYNQGFVTENVGTATILNGQTSTGAFAHGLSITPTIVLAVGSSADTEDLYIVSIGAVNLEISVAAGAVGGNRTIYWKAEYY